MYITADAYTKDELIEWRFGCFSALEFRISMPTAAHFLESVGQVRIELTLSDFYEWILAITSCVLGSDHFQLFFNCPRAQQLLRSGA